MGVRNTFVASAAQLYSVTGSGGVVLETSATLNPRNVGRCIYVDGVHYTFDAAGIQAAINDANNFVGVGNRGKVILPPTPGLPSGVIDLGSTSLTIPTNVTLEGAGPNSTLLQYSGSSAAIILASGTTGAIVRSLQLFLGPTANGVLINGDANGGLATHFNRFEDVEIQAVMSTTGQIGFHLQGTSTPTDISLNWFVNVFIFNLDKPIVTLHTEGNHWEDLEIGNFGGVAGRTAFDQTDNFDEFIKARIVTNVDRTSGTHYSCTGSSNIVQLTADSYADYNAINDTGGRNIFIYDLIDASRGTIAATSIAIEAGASSCTIISPTVNAITGFQVNGSALAAANLSNGVTGSGAVVLAASPTISGTLNCAALAATGDATLANVTEKFTQDTNRFGAAAYRITPTSGNNIAALTLLPSGSATESNLRLYNANGSNGADVGFVEFDLAGSTMTIRADQRGAGTTPTKIEFDMATSLATISLFSTGGITIGSPTGGDQGQGKLNVQNGYYANGAAGVSAGSFAAITAITATNGLVTQLTGTSDERLKTGIIPFERGLSDILKVQPIRYRWNEAGQKKTGFKAEQEFAGFSAQNVQGAIPEAIGQEGEYLSFSDRPVLAALVNAVRELSQRIEELENG